MSVSRMSLRMGARVGLAAVLGLSSACEAPAQTTLPAEVEGTPQVLAQLADTRINEASGLVASRRHADCFYVHNDSGGGPFVYLIDRHGQTRLTIRLQGAQAADYEDIALVPGAEPGTFDVCVGDIGDNDGRRSVITIYRFAEPELPVETGSSVVVQPRAYRFRYPDGPRDAEALAVHPQTGDGYIITKKTSGGAEVYKLPAPWDEGRVTVLVRLGALKMPPAFAPLQVVTAADISPDGRRLAVRCYADGWEWHLAPGGTVEQFDSVFQTMPRRLPLALERQGEALCYLANGSAILTLSEGVAPCLYLLPIIDSSAAPGR